jgi:hypothetical protein
MCMGEISADRRFSLPSNVLANLVSTPTGLVGMPAGLVCKLTVLLGRHTGRVRTYLLQFPATKDIIFKVKDIRFIPPVCPDPKDKLVVGRKVEVISDKDEVDDGGHV